MTEHHVLPFAEQLKHFRRNRGFTQEQLAERAGLSARGIRALEQGERLNPHRDTVRLLADGLEQIRCGKKPPARELLERALAIFEKLGAWPDAETTRSALTTAS